MIKKPRRMRPNKKSVKKAKLQGAAQEAVLPKDPHDPIDIDISDDGLTKLSKKKKKKTTSNARL